MNEDDDTSSSTYVRFSIDDGGRDDLLGRPSVDSVQRFSQEDRRSVDSGEWSRNSMSFHSKPKELQTFFDHNIQKVVPEPKAKKWTFRKAVEQKLRSLKRNVSVLDSTVETKKMSRFLHEEYVDDGKLDNILRRKGVILFLCGIFGVLLMVVTQIINFQWYYDNKLIYQTERVYLPRIFIGYYIVKSLNVLVTILCIFLLINYYATLADLKKKQWGFINRFTAFRTSSLMPKFFMELLIIILTPLPGLERLWGLGDKTGLFMFARFYLVVRVVRDYSEVYRKRKQIIFSNAEYRRTLPQFGWQLTLRVLFYSSTIATLLIVTLTTTFIAAFCIWVVEREYNAGLRNFWNTVYFTTITMTTIGYGDYHPTQVWGRITAVLQGVIGILIVTIFSGVVINKLTPTEQQKYAVRFIREEGYVRQRFEAAVTILQVQWLWKHQKCSAFYRHNTIKKCIKKLRKLRRKLAKAEHEMTVEESLSALLSRNEEMSERISNLNTLLTDIKQALVVGNSRQPQSLRFRSNAVKSVDYSSAVNPTELLQL